MTRKMRCFILLAFAFLALTPFCAFRFMVSAEPKKASSITCEISPDVIRYGESVNISGRLTDLSTSVGLQRIINITYSEDNGSTWNQLKELDNELTEYGNDIWTNETGRYGPYTWHPERIPHNFLVKAFFYGDEEYEQVNSSIQTLTVTLPPNPPVEILNQRSYTWYNTTFWIVGEVQNVGTTNLEWIKMTAVYHDSVGVIIGTDGFYIQSRLITPGQKSPFITFAGISYSSSINASLIASYELVVRAYSSTTEELYMGLQVTSQETSYDDWGNYHVSGELKNNGMLFVESVTVIATFYGSDGKVVDTWFGLPDPNQLNPNETATFDIELYKSRLEAIGPIDHHILQVDYYITKILSSISCSVFLSDTPHGKVITVTGVISPVPGAVNVTLTFTKPDGTSFTVIVTTTSDGLFTYTFKPETSGEWSVKASWPGSVNYEGATSRLVPFIFEGEHAIVTLTRETPQPETLVVAVTVGAAVSAGFAALMGFSGFGQSVSSAISRLGIPEWLKDLLQPYLEETFKTVSQEELEAIMKAPLITRREAATIGVSALVVAIVFGFVEANGLPWFLDPSVLIAVIPLTLLTAGIIIVAQEFFGALIPKMYKIRAEFKIWLYGLIAFIISGLLFKIPFSTPGKASYQGSNVTKQISGIIVISKMLWLLALLIPFSALIMLGFKTIGDTGLLVNLMVIAYSLIPLKPLEGKEIYNYSKKAWLAFFVPVLLLFSTYILNLCPYIVYLAIGFISALLWIVIFYQTRPKKE